jgi:uncharacterized protein (DUF736 family)
MANIGTLHPTQNGGWIGFVFVMAHRIRITLSPNDNRVKANAPSFRVFSGGVELGAFWGRQRKEARPRDYLSGEIDFPGLSEPLGLAVFFSDDGQNAKVVWNRRRQEDRPERAQPPDRCEATVTSLPRD